MIKLLGVSGGDSKFFLEYMSRLVTDHMPQFDCKTNYKHS